MGVRVYDDEGGTETAAEVVRAGLAATARQMERAGLFVGEPRGKLLRPLVAFAALQPAARARVDERFWCGALAIQMVHEASLLHDDILDGAATRRGAQSVAAREGLGTALVRGDHLLTGAYRVAAAAELPLFLRAFIHAVERTVAGEIAQQRGVGRVLSAGEYREAIEGKSGALFGAAVALAEAWDDRAEDRGLDAEAAGCRIGALYQMVDDTLDYCPSANSGKPPLQDFAQKKWTFVLDAAGLTDFSLGASEVMGRLFEPRSGDGMNEVLLRLEAEARGCIECFPYDDGLMAGIVDSWVDAAHRAIAAEKGSFGTARLGVPTTPPSVEAEVAELARAVGDARDWGWYFGVHSKSFRFASRLFPAAERRSIEGVYAFCRFTDDLVDETDVDPSRARARLEAWRLLTQAAYEGSATGVPLADLVMGEAAQKGVPFHYPDELLTGVGMDLDPVCFERVSDLEVYTYRVASVVGGWVTELFGVRDAAVLARAYRLGHAMQITNILRDVGEDWRSDRLYLPRDLMDVHGVGPSMIDGVVSGRGPVPLAYQELCEELMSIADQHYEAAFSALPDLPRSFARPVAVAARVYQGIHDEIRRLGYDNGTHRAHTRFTRKLRLGLVGLVDLRRSIARRPVPGIVPAPYAAKAE